MVPRLALSVLPARRAARPARSGRAIGPRLRGAVPDLRPGRGDDVDAVGAGATTCRSRRTCSGRCRTSSCAGCLTLSADLDLAAAAPPVVDGGAAIAPIRVHAGVVTSMEDEAAALAFFAAHGVAGAQHRRGGPRAAHLPRAVRDRGRRSTARPRWRGRPGSPRPTRPTSDAPASALAPGRRGRRLHGGAAAAAASRRAARRCSCATTRRRGTTRTAGSTRTAPSCRRASSRAPSEALHQQRLPDPLGRPRRPAGALRAAAAVPDRDGGPAIRPVPVHLGIVTGISDEALVTRYFRGLGYRSRGIGAEGLGRRIYIGPFTTQGAARPGAGGGARGRVHRALRGEATPASERVRSPRRWRAGSRGRCPSRPR